MKYLSLFSGIGGFELGITQAYEAKNSGLVNQGGQVDSVSGRQEKEYGAGMGNTYAERPSDESHESIPLCIGFSEIDKYASKIYQHHFREHKAYGDITKINETELPDFDLLVGGFPCQAFSIAGKRGGFNDTRGTLFFEIARILKHKQPRLFLLENVKGLLSHDEGRTFATIIATLDELGYDLQWQVLNSKNFGVPQNRERVFIVGHLRGTSRPQVFPITGSNPTSTLNTGEDISYALDANYHKGTNTLEKGRRQLVKIIGGLQGHQTAREDGVSPTLTQAMGQGGGQTPIVWSEEIRIRRLTPTECARLQGFPDHWHKVEGISDTQAYKVYGNAVTTNVIKEIVKRMI